MGYGNELWWPAFTNVTFQPQATEISSHIPLRLRARASACSLALNPRKFDFGRRSCTPPSAQNDIQRYYFAVFVRKNRRTQFARTEYNKIHCRDRPSELSAKKQTHIVSKTQPLGASFHFGLVFIEKCKKTIDKYNKSGYNI